MAKAVRPSPVKAKSAHRYKFIRKLGAGGMSSVFLAFDRSKRRKVAIKILERGLTMDKRHILDFLNETKNLMRLEHDNIVRVLDGFREGEWLGYVMEYIEGDTLDSFLGDRRRLSQRSIRDKCVSLLNALDHLHEHGIVHMDIKPSNLIERNDGVLKLIDLGVSKAMSPYAKGFETSERESVTGTLMYMSPEQIKSRKSVDHRSDLYSVGLMLWEMVKGHHPYKGLTDREDVVDSIISKALPDTGTFWDPIIRKATQKNPLKRYASAYAMNLAVSKAYEDRNKFILQSPSMLRRIYHVRELSSCKKPALTAICDQLRIKTNSETTVGELKSVIVTHNLKKAGLTWVQDPSSQSELQALMKKYGISKDLSLCNRIDALSSRLSVIYTRQELLRIQPRYLPVIAKMLCVKAASRCTDKMYREAIAMHNMRRLSKPKLAALAKKNGIGVNQSAAMIMNAIYMPPLKDYGKHYSSGYANSKSSADSKSSFPKTLVKSEDEAIRKVPEKKRLSFWERVVRFFT